MTDRPRLGKIEEKPPMVKSTLKKRTGKVITRGIEQVPRPKPTADYTQFRRFYDRGDLPIARNFTNNEHGPIEWKVSPDLLDYHHYLPMFFDGLRETAEPYWFFAYYGTLDLIQKGKSKIMSTLPQLIMPLKKALNTREPIVLCRVMTVIQALVGADPLIGESLVPYYRQILPVFNEFFLSNLNIGDQIEYGQRKRLNLSDLIQETLEVMERTGGPDAFVNIKYIIPPYQSTVVGGG